MLEEKDVSGLPIVPFLKGQAVQASFDTFKLEDKTDVSEIPISSFLKSQAVQASSDSFTLGDENRRFGSTYHSLLEGSICPSFFGQFYP
jgi:hypothetical protein